jgi:transcriptional regulator with XRE-family HTH domain
MNYNDTEVYKMNNLQDFLINKRKELKLSLRNAANLIGISHTYLNTLEKGVDPRNNIPTKPTPETLELIAKAYDVSYEYLMKLTGYLSEEKKELTAKDEKDIEKRINKLRQDLMESSEGFMLSGEPVSKEAIDSILDALALGVRHAKIINKKFTPKSSHIKS